MSILKDVHEALDNSVHNTSFKEVMDKSSMEIAGELKEYTTGFEDVEEDLLVDYINMWKSYHKP